MAIRGRRNVFEPRGFSPRQEMENEFSIPSFEYLPPSVDEDAIQKALEAITVRKEANDAISNATDQYEADVADFKNNQATEIEQGIAALPEIANLSQTPFVPEGLGSFTPPNDSIIPRMPNESVVPFTPPPSMSIGRPVETPEEEFRFNPPTPPTIIAPPSFDIDERDFLDTIGDVRPPAPPSFDQLPPVFEEPIFTPPPVFEDERPPMDVPSPIDFITPPSAPIFTPPPVFEDEPIYTPPGFEDGFEFPGGNPDFDFGGNPFIPPDDMPVIPPIDSPIGNPYEGIFPPINFPPPGNIGDPGEGDFDDTIGEPPFDFPPGFFDGIFPPIDFPPIDPPYVPPITDPDPITPPPPPPPPSGPINYYTGQPINNPYQPYATDSGAAPLKRAIDPRTFGQAPGFESKQPQPIPIRPPRKFPPKPPQVPPPRDFPEELRFVAMAPAGAKGGGYLNKGISQLPMNGQGDTLTTQVFQSGFRPRR